MTVPDPLGREPPEFPAQGGDIPVLNPFGQTLMLERQDQVVGPQDHFHVSGIGPEAAGRDLSHGIGVLELA